MKCCKAVKGGISDGNGGGVKTVRFGIDWSTNKGQYRTRQQGAGAAFRYTWQVPPDFSALVEVVMRCCPDGDFTDETIELFSDYGGNGQSCFRDSETDSLTVSGTADVWQELPLSSVFSSLQAGDTCGVQIDHDGLGTPVDYAQVILRYI